MNEINCCYVCGEYLGWGGKTTGYVYQKLVSVNIEKYKKNKDFWVVNNVKTHINDCWTYGDNDLEYFNNVVLPLIKERQENNYNKIITYRLLWNPVQDGEWDYEKGG